MKAVLLALAAILIVVPIPLFIGDPSNKVTASDPSASIGEMEPHVPITIVDDNGFNASNGVKYGNGTKENPYIIENYDISTYMTGDPPLLKGGISIRSTKAWTIIQNCAIHGNEFMLGTGIGLSYLANVMIINCTFIYNYAALQLQGTEDCMVLNCTFTKNNYGIVILSSSSNLIKDNVLYNNSEGISCSIGTKINLTGNMCHNNSFAGIMINLNILLTCYNNTCFGNKVGGIVYTPSADPRFGDEIWIIKNRCYRNIDSGIKVIGNSNANVGNRLYISSNNISDNIGDGISLEICTQPWIYNNLISRNGNGLNITNVLGQCHIQNNMIVSNKDNGLLYGQGIYSDRSNVIVTKNSVMGNRNGMRITKNPATIKANYILDNEIGFINENRDGTSLIYDNYIGNIIDVRSLGLAEYSIEKKTGPNIIGGELLGGNFWKKYKGSDLNGDGIGDTMVPFGEDRFPLVYPVNISVIDLSGSKAETGGSFKMSFHLMNTSFAAIREYSTKVEFFTGGFSYNTIFDPVFSGVTYLNATIVVYDRADHIKYSFNCTDMYYNEHKIEVTIPVTDATPPIITDSIIGRYETGRNTTMMFSILDNIGISNISFEYQIDLGSISRYRVINHTIETLNDTDYYTFKPYIGETQTTFNGTLNVTDVNGLSTIVAYRDVPVMDVIPPAITDRTEGILKEGSSHILKFEVKDNIEVNSTYLEGAFAGTDIKFKYILDPTKNEHLIEVAIPTGTGELSYSVWSVDTSGNSNHLERTVPIHPQKVFEVKDDSTDLPRTGLPYHVYFNIRPLVENVTHFLYYYYDDEPSNDTFSGNSIYLRVVPVESKVLHYGVVAIDANGSTFQWDFNRTIVDIITPTVEILHDSPESGKMLDIFVKVMENHDLEHVHLNYSIGGIWTSVPLSNDSKAQVSVPIDARTITFKASAMDRSGNYRNVTLDLCVKDAISPLVENFKQYLRHERGSAKLQVAAIITDNWKISNVTLICNSDLGTHRYYPRLSQTGAMNCEVVLDRSAGNVTLVLVVRDEGANEVSSAEIWVQIEPLESSASTFPYFQYLIVLIVILVFMFLFFYLRKASKPKYVFEE